MLTEKERAEFAARLESEGVEFARSRDGDFAGRCESLDKRLAHALANCTGTDRLALMAARVRLADLADDLPRRMTREERGKHERSLAGAE